MNPTLKRFYDDELARETVKSFMIEVLKDLTIERAFEGKSVEGIPEAKALVEKMFDTLEIQYGKIKEPIINNSR